MMNYSTMKTVTGRTIRRRHATPGPKPLPPEVLRRRINISLAPHWHDTGKRLAEESGLPFSRYIENLIYQDSVCKESA